MMTFVGFGLGPAGGALVMTRSTDRSAVLFESEPMTPDGRLVRFGVEKPVPLIVPLNLIEGTDWR
jgi:hypothetical protein